MKKIILISAISSVCIVAGFMIIKPIQFTKADAVVVNNSTNPTPTVDPKNIVHVYDENTGKEIISAGISSGATIVANSITPSSQPTSTPKPTNVPMTNNTQAQACHTHQVCENVCD